MAINLRGTGKLLEQLLYGDSMSVYRYKKAEKEDGSTYTKLAEEAEIKEVPCKISFSQKDNSEITSIENNITIVITIFTSLDHDIKAGDFIEVKRVDPVTKTITKVKGNAGEPNRLENHQVFELLKKEIA